MAPYFYGNNTISYTTDTVWLSWTDTSASTDAVWSSWTFSANTITNVASVEPTEEQREQQCLEREKQETAKQNARDLLASCLTAKQRREFNKNGWFHVETANGRRRYRLAPGRAPIRVHGEDGSQWSYCIHPAYGFPAEDVVLAQKLLLEADEDSFLAIANASRVNTINV